MDSNEIKEWIKTLKCGDKVVIVAYRFGHDCYSIHTVKNVTKTGKIKLTGGNLFDTCGYRRIDAWFSENIIPYDEKMKEYFRKNKICNELAKFKFVDLELEKLEQIYKIINKK
jgi:hypothetical protein